VQQQVGRGHGTTFLNIDIVLIGEDDAAMASLETTPDTLRVRLTRAERLAGLLRDVEVPRSAVTGVDVVADPLCAVRGLRAPGLALPGRRVGTWRRSGERTLVSVRRGQPAVRVRLAGQRLTTLLVGADDAAAVAARVGTPAAGGR
jgi:hypothetical protein